jgi:exo-beta-1,3-glucanase (GH17 family)
MNLRIKDKVMETMPEFMQFSDLVRHYNLDYWKTSGTSSLGIDFIRGHAEKRVSSCDSDSVLVNITEIAAFVSVDGEVISYAMFADCDTE